LSERANHLYVDGSRYWFSPQPSVTRLAEERGQQLAEDEVHEEILRRLRVHAKQRGEFSAVQAAPENADVPDEREARLVLLGPEHPHTKNQNASPARREAQTILDGRGAAPRLFRNALVFLAPDATRLSELDGATRRYLAWRRIFDENEILNLDAFQRKQAQQKTKDWDDTCHQRLLESWCWLLLPTAPQNAVVGTPLEWQETRLPKGDALASAASRKLRTEGHLQIQLGPCNLRLELDRVPLWQGDHVGVKQLLDFFAQYLYLPRLKGPTVLLEAIAQGVAAPAWTHDTFAYAESFDAKTGRYRGLTGGTPMKAPADLGGVLVRPEAAIRQLGAETATAGPVNDSLRTSAVSNGHGASEAKLIEGTHSDSVKATVFRRFHGSIQLDPTRMSRDAGRIAEEVVQHLAALVGAELTVTLEIQMALDTGIPDKVRMVVGENCRTLKFRIEEFDK
jgi:hypothetical protein